MTHQRSPTQPTLPAVASLQLVGTARFHALSPREFGVLDLLATGATNAQMARVLGLSEGTVRNVIARLTVKLGVVDRTQAALVAFRAGLGQLTGPILAVGTR